MFTINGNNPQATLISVTYNKAAACASTLAFPIIKLKQSLDSYFHKPQTIPTANEHVSAKEISERASVIFNKDHSYILADLIQNGIKDYHTSEVENAIKANLEHLPLNLFFFIQSFSDFCENFDSVQNLITDEEESVIESLHEYIDQSFSDCKQENSVEDLIKLFQFKKDLLSFDESVNKWLQIFCNIRMETPIDVVTNLTNTLKNIKRRIVPLLHSIDATSGYCFEYLPPLPISSILGIIGEIHEINKQIDDTFRDIKEELENDIEALVFGLQDPNKQLYTLVNANALFSKIGQLTLDIDKLNDEGNSDFLDLEQLENHVSEFNDKYRLLHDQTLQIDLKIDQKTIKEIISNLRALKDLYNNSLIDLCNDISAPWKILANAELINKHLDTKQLEKFKTISKSINILVNETEYESISFEPLLELLQGFYEHYESNDKEARKFTLINKAIDLATILNTKEQVDPEFNSAIAQLYIILKTVLLKSKKALLRETKTISKKAQNTAPTKKIHTELDSICKTFESVYLKEHKKDLQLLNKTLSEGVFPTFEQLDFIKSINIMERLSFYNAIDSNGELKFTPSPIAFSIKTFTTHEMDDFFKHVIYKFDSVTKALNQINTDKDIGTPILSEEMIKDFQRLYVICSKVNESEIKLLDTKEQIAIEQRLEFFIEAVSLLKNEGVLRQLFTGIPAL